MNNYTTARAPLRQSELSYLLAEKISAPAPVAEVKPAEAVAVKPKRVRKAKP